MVSRHLGAVPLNAESRHKIGSHLWRSRELQNYIILKSSSLHPPQSNCPRTQLITSLKNGCVVVLEPLTYTYIYLPSVCLVCPQYVIASSEDVRQESSLKDGFPLLTSCFLNSLYSSNANCNIRCCNTINSTVSSCFSK